MVYEYGCSKCTSIVELNRPIDDRDLPVLCECGTIRKRLLPRKIQLSIPDRYVSEYNREQARQDDRDYEKMWEEKSAGAVKSDNRTMAELYAESFGGS